VAIYLTEEEYLDLTEYKRLRIVAKSEGRFVLAGVVERTFEVGFFTYETGRSIRARSQWI
jgi:hypothetical protein